MPRQYIPEPVSTEVWPPPSETAPRQTSWEKLTKKFKEEPLVPIGIAATVAALLGASRALQSGNRTQFNKLLRYRVAAQGFTVVAALGGSVYYQAERQAKRKADQAASLVAAEATPSTTSLAAATSAPQPPPPMPPTRVV